MAGKRSYGWQAVIAAVGLILAAGNEYQFTAFAAGAETAASGKAGETANAPSRPVPNRDVQQRYLTQLEEAFRVSEKQKPADKLQLAGELLKLGRSGEQDPNERFVTLRQAAELAADAGDAAMMLEAVNALTKEFELDSFAAKEKLLARTAERILGETAIGTFLKSLMPVIDEAVGEERIDLAMRLTEIGDRMTQRPSGQPFHKEVHQRYLVLQKLHGQWVEVQKALAVLESKWDDPDANLVVGRWYAFMTGDWDAAIPCLARGSDPVLKAAAAKDAAGATSAEEQVQLGDNWWDLAAGRPDAERVGCLQRAGSWYERAQETLPAGLIKTKVTNRLADIGKVRKPQFATFQQRPSGTIPRGRWIEVLRNVQTDRDVRAGQWTTDRGALAAGADARLALPILIDGSYDLQVDFMRTGGHGTVLFQLPTGPNSCSLILSGWLGKVHGLSDIDGRSALQNPTSKRPGKLPNNVPHRLLVQVRIEGDRAAIAATLDNAPLLQWSGKADSLRPSIEWPTPRQPALCTANSTVIFHSVRIRLTSGEATLTPSTKPAAGTFKPPAG